MVDLRGASLPASILDGGLKQFRGADAGGGLLFDDGSGRAHDFVAVVQAGGADNGRFSVNALRGDGKGEARLAAHDGDNGLAVHRLNGVGGTSQRSSASSVRRVATAVMPGNTESKALSRSRMVTG